MRKNATLSAEEYASDRQGIAERFLPLSSRLAFEIWVRGGKRADLSELKSEAQLALVMASRSWDPNKGDLPVHLTCHIKWKLLHFLSIQKPSGYRFSSDEAPSTVGLTYYSTEGKKVHREIQNPSPFLECSMDAMQLHNVIRNSHLSPREESIVRRFAAGETAAQIAERFNSYETAIYSAKANAVRLMKDALARHKPAIVNRRQRYNLIQKLLIAPLGTREFFWSLPEETPKITRSRIASRLAIDRRGTYFVWSTRAVAGGASVLKLAARYAKP